MKPDVIIVGAGAAGLMTAISAARHGVRTVLLLDQSQRPGLKILMSGGGRCNLTNGELDLNRYRCASVNSLKKVILQFPPSEVIAFFNQLGVSTKTEEPWKKVFPVSDQAQSVLAALLGEIRRAGIRFQFPESVLKLMQQPDGWMVETNHGRYLTPRVVVASGGFSYPHTGSDGRLWNMLDKLGVPMTAPIPALTPLHTNGRQWHQLSGMTLQAALTVTRNGKPLTTRTDSLLFTHQGISGPAAMDVSEWFASESGGTRLTVNFLPGTDLQTADSTFLAYAKLHPDQMVVTWLNQFIPDRLSRLLAELSGTAGIRLNQITRNQRLTLLGLLTGSELPVSGTGGYKKAEVTAGGIELGTLNLKTMEIRTHPGLYTVGEIVDVHGPIGGYNFQWAWSSGWVCGKGLAV
ncbi:MAG: aminoacetone oxidase family FAD-binding enzyme [Bacteroidetes bacterium]|nr:aminoacetone oxidase family FAD-binding enzyme [Bacteroidota bacterium]